VEILLVAKEAGPFACLGPFARFSFVKEISKDNTKRTFSQSISALQHFCQYRENAF